MVARRRRATRFAPGDRVGIAWLRHTCGSCDACRRGRENLCRAAAFTGWDADGGFAEYAVVPEAYAYRLPDGRRRPAGRAAAVLRDHRLPRAAAAAAPPGGRLGIYGFGASAHLTAQLGDRPGSEVHVLTREPKAQRLALELGAASAARRLRRAAGAAGLGDPVRPGGRPGAGRPSRRSTRAARWRSPASTSATCRRSTTTATSSASAP